MKKKLIWLVVAVLAMAACEPQTGNIESTYTLGPTAVVVGDSISNGGRTYLHAELGRHFATKIAAVAGATYSSMRRYSEPYSQDRSDIAVIALGTNDRQLRWVLATSLADLNQTYDWFAGSCTVGVTITTNHSDPEVNTKASAINEAAAARADIMVDWDAVDHEPGMTQADGTHPTAEGHQRRAEMIAEGAEACGENPHVPPTTTTTTVPDETTTTTVPDETTTTTTTTVPDETTTGAGRDAVVHGRTTTTTTVPDETL